MTMDLPDRSASLTAMPPNSASASAPLARPGPGASSQATSAVEIGLSAAIISVRNDEPRVLIVRGTHDLRLPKNVRPPSPTLPFGPFAPRDHRTLDAGLRSWVNEQTGLDLGYVEQLYTFADRGRHASEDQMGPHLVSIGYLALVGPGDDDAGTTRWRSWYDFFPWEDWRSGKPRILSETIEPLLLQWAERGDTSEVNGHQARSADRIDRLHIAFGMDGGNWDEEKVLERFELLYEAGLVEEAERDGRDTAGEWPDLPVLGQALGFDHRRILATSIGRIRAKIKYRPVVFELMPGEFTLFELQKTVEAILGPHLHKQNFRRLVESAGLVETTGEVRVKTGGRPARLYQFRRKVLLERPAPGVRVNLSRH